MKDDRAAVEPVAEDSPEEAEEEDEEIEEEEEEFVPTQR